MSSHNAPSRHQFRNADLAWLPSFARMLGARPPDDFVSNGATTSPDVILGWDLRPAAHFHDFHYSDQYPGLRNESARYRADQIFLQNLNLCGLPRILAVIYYFRVRLWGHGYYAYSRGWEPQRTLRFWIGLLFGRYVTW